MERVYNFSAGPAMLPLPVLEQARNELICYGNAGCSVLEMSHRSKPYIEIIERAEATLRRLMNIGDDYAVLFLQGGASMQFSMVPMNLAKRGDKADYAVSGMFANKALTEAKRWCAARAVTSSKEDGFSYVPELKAELVDPDAAYVHITANNTIYGTMYREIPQNLPAPLACDMSSIILGKQFDVRDFGLIYAGAQKNMGPAGLTVVIVRRDLIPDDVDSVVPSMLQYKSFADSGSMYNTPPCYSIYIAGLVYEHIEREGGVAEFERRNRKKAELLYDCIDNSDFFGGTALFQDRSIMNVTFTLANAEQTDDFVAFAKARGIIGIKGHRAVGGCRASIYNAMPQSGVEALVECMKEYESKKA